MLSIPGDSPFVRCKRQIYVFSAVGRLVSKCRSFVGLSVGLIIISGDCLSCSVVLILAFCRTYWLLCGNGLMWKFLHKLICLSYIETVCRTLRFGCSCFTLFSKSFLPIKIGLLLCYKWYLVLYVPIL